MQESTSAADLLAPAILLWRLWQARQLVPWHLDWVAGHPAYPQRLLETTCPGGTLAALPWSAVGLCLGLVAEWHGRRLCSAFCPLLRPAWPLRLAFGTVMLYFSVSAVLMSSMKVKRKLEVPVSTTTDCISLNMLADSWSLRKRKTMPCGA